MIIDIGAERRHRSVKQEEEEEGGNRVNKLPKTRPKTNKKNQNKDKIKPRTLTK